MIFCKVIEGVVLGLEIERKFLVKGTTWKTDSPIFYSQGYLNLDKERTVRIRIAGEQAFLTIKGLSMGVMRPEFEYSVPVSDAEEMMELCMQPLINKYRHIIHCRGSKWEVDEFIGENSGLVLAELELESENQGFEKPGWLGEEVSGDERYFNSNLVRNPFRLWAVGEEGGNPDNSNYKPGS